MYKGNMTRNLMNEQKKNTTTRRNNKEKLSAQSL